MAKHQLLLLAFLVAFCAFSMAVKENYPFSNYPMYGDPDPMVFYHYLADGEGKPLATYPLVGKSAAQIGKIIRTRSIDRAKTLKTDPKKMPPAEWEVVCRDTLTYLRQQSQTLGTTLPGKLRLVRVEVRFEGERFSETPRVLFAE